MKWNMAPLFLQKREPWILEKAAMEESVSDLRNPSIGWYQIFRFPLEQQWEPEIVASSLDDSEQLVFVMPDIGAYRSRELDAAALENLRNILMFFRSRGKEMILRPTYDTIGQGMEHEPTRFDQVQRHVLQLTGVLRAFAKDIYIIQGILVGSWGEMHNSRHLAPNRIAAVLDMLDSQMGGEVFLSVRKPSYLRLVRPEAEWNAHRENRIGLFNDAIFGSGTDMGTYGILTRSEAGWERSWTAAEELAFQDTLCRTVPNGGEVICPETEPPTLEQSVDRLRKMHISYLNSRYDGRLLELWRNQKWLQPGVWQGMNGLDYIGRHLGYRFRVLNAGVQNKLLSGKAKLTVELENVGFSACYFPVQLTLCQRLQNGEVCQQMQKLPACSLDGGSKTSFCFDVEPAESTLFLKMTRASDGRRIRFGTSGETEAEGLPIGVLKKNQEKLG